MIVDLKRGATILELIMSVFTVLAVVVTSAVTISVTQARQDERIKQLEGNYNDIRSSLREIGSDVRALNNGQNGILLQLKDKADRETLK